MFVQCCVCGRFTPSCSSLCKHYILCAHALIIFHKYSCFFDISEMLRKLAMSVIMQSQEFRTNVVSIKYYPECTHVPRVRHSGINRLTNILLCNESHVVYVSYLKQIRNFPAGAQSNKTAFPHVTCYLKYSHVCEARVVKSRNDTKIMGLSESCVVIYNNVMVGKYFLLLALLHSAG